MFLSCRMQFLFRITWGEMIMKISSFELEWNKCLLVLLMLTRRLYYIHRHFILWFYSTSTCILVYPLYRSLYCVLYLWSVMQNKCGMFAVWQSTPFFLLERQGFTLLSVETYTCRLQEISNCQSFILFDMFKYTYSLWSHFICLRISVKRWNIKRKYCCGSSFMCELHRGIWFIVVLRADVSSCKLAALLMISIAIREDGECNLQ